MFLRCFVASSTGQSGRQYLVGDVLYCDEVGSETVFKATCKDTSIPVVINRVSASIYDLSQRVGSEFAGSKWLRLPIDYCNNSNDSMVVYPYLKDTILNLVRTDPDFPEDECKKALRRVGEGLREFHGKGWLHLDVKPDNVFVDWTADRKISRAALGDFGISFKPEGDVPLRTQHPIGNFMWRSPEAQTGSGMTKASDVYSFGLLCIYVFGGTNYLLIEDAEELFQLAEAKIKLEEAILSRHFAYFGPVTEGLLQRVDKRWRTTLAKLADDAAFSLQGCPGLSFKVWGAPLGPTAMDLLSRLTKPDPTGRPTMDDVMSHPWWEEKEAQ